MHSTVIDLASLPIGNALLKELRSDHAGEYGAVVIYNGILAVSRDSELRAFASEHRATERQHLDFMIALLPPDQRTRLLPIWYVMAWTLGALPALFGRRAVYITIEAVETFVEQHYQRQLDLMAGRPELRALRDKLAQFCADEVAHKKDAGSRYDPPLGTIGKLWQAVVGRGSYIAVLLAKNF